MAQAAEKTTVVKPANQRVKKAIGAAIVLGVILAFVLRRRPDWLTRAKMRLGLAADIPSSSDSAAEPEQEEAHQPSWAASGGAFVFGPKHHLDGIVNEDQVMGKWREIKGQVTAKWGELTDDEVTEAKGELEQLAGKIQQKYGGTKAEIHRQLQEF